MPRYGLTDEELAERATVFAPRAAAGMVFIISGAGSGMGRAMSYLFARLGAHVVLAGRREDPLRETERGIARFGGRTLVVPTNIRKPDEVARLMDAAWEGFERVDVLVNNAGGQFPQPAIDYTEKGWNAVIDTNLNGSWYMMQGAAKRWVAQSRPGCIITITAAVDRGLTGMAHTTASRAGVNFLSKTLAVEWAPYNIRVNCVAPGAIESTGFHNYKEEHVPSFSKCNPMLHTGDVQDIAEAVVYLAAPSGKFVTGEVLNVEGGMMLWGEFWPSGKPEYFNV